MFLHCPNIDISSTLASGGGVEKSNGMASLCLSRLAVFVLPVNRTRHTM